jgi:hypothetical protein
MTWLWQSWLPGREKDKDFVSALIRVGLLDVAVIRRRADVLPTDTDPRVGQRIQTWLSLYGDGP